MRRWDVEVEHKFKDRLVQKRVFTGSKKVSVIGSVRDADLRLLGDGVEGIHAYLERSDDGWNVIDAGSEHGTWMGSDAVQTVKIDSTCKIQIGPHELQFRPIEFERGLFHEQALENNGSEQFHQIVVRKSGHLVGTHLVASHQSFDFDYVGQTVRLAPPKTGETTEREIEGFLVTQRLVNSDVVKFEPKSPQDYLKGPEAKVAIFSLSGLLFLFLLLMIALPNSNDSELVPPTIDENRFTKMIYDSDLIKKKRSEAKARQKQMMAKAPSGPKNKAVGPAPAKGGAPRVVSKLKMSGLQAMLGKISARASKNAIKITGSGFTPDKAGTGRAIAAVNPGSLQGIATQAGNGGSTYKVGAVGTVGAGGGSGLKGIGGLASGGVGSASVGILDEESEIEGGLDKDVIARVINSQLGEIRYCYERQLAAEPDIYGKVVVRFSIDAGGTVNTQRVGLTTLRSAIVEGCILRRVASWKFPKPRGGTTVLVTYPFLFKSTN